MEKKYTIYSSVSPGVENMTKKINNTMKNFGFNEELCVGWKIGTLTVNTDSIEVKKKIEEIITDQAGVKVWLEGV